MKKLPTSAGLGDQFQSNVSSGDESAKGSSDFVETSEQRNVWNLHELAELKINMHVLLGIRNKEIC